MHQDGKRGLIVQLWLSHLQLLSCSCCPSGDKPHVTKMVKEEADGANQGSVGQWGWVPDSAVLLFGQVLCTCPPMWLVQLGVRPPFCTCACVACCSGPACSASLVRTGAAHRGVSAHTGGGAGPWESPAWPLTDSTAALPCPPALLAGAPEETRPGHRVSANGVRRMQGASTAQGTSRAHTCS